MLRTDNHLTIARIMPKAKNDLFPEHPIGPFDIRSIPSLCILQNNCSLLIRVSSLSQFALRFERLHQPFVLHFGHVRQSVDRIGFLRACCEGLLSLHVGRGFAQG